MGGIPEQYGDMAAFASLRQPAWHGLGTVFDKPVSTMEMLNLAHMSGWNVRLRPLETDARSEVPTFEVVRTNPFDAGLDRLGVVGKRYTVFSNEEIFDFGDTLTDDRRRWETAGSMFGGSTVFASLVDTDDIVLDPNGSADVIRKYLILASSHDGSSTLVAKKVNTRVVCENTLTAALGERGPEFKIRHTQGISTKVEDAKKALGYARVYDEAFEAEAQALFAADCTDKQFWGIVNTIFPKPTDPKKGADTKWTNKTDGLVAVWNNSTRSMTDLPKNGWRAWQALTEDNQWNRGVRKGNMENFFAAGAGFDGPTNVFRTKSLEVVKSALISV